MATRAERIARGYVYLNPADFKRLQGMKFNKASLIKDGIDYFLGPNEAARLGFANPSSGTQTGGSAPAPAPAPTPTPTPSVDPAQAAAREARDKYIAQGYQYLSSMTAVVAAQKAGQTVQKIGLDYFIVPAQTQDQAMQAAREARASYVAQGYTYLNSMDAVKAAEKAGQTVQKIGVDYFIVPSKPAAVSANTPTAPVTPITQETSQSVTQGLTPAEQIAGSERPDIPNLTQTFEELRQKNNISTMEETLNKLDTELTAIDDAYTAGQNKVESGLAPMEILSGRAKELEKQYQERRATVLREREDVARQLTTKYNTVNAIMELTGQQYSLALQDYNSRFEQNLQMQSYFDSKAEAKQTSARANLNTVISGLQESGKTWSQLSESLKMNVAKLEMESGLPIGTTEAFFNTMPEAKLLATVNGTDSSGNDIITFVYADKNGNPGVIKTIKTGGYSKVSGSGGGIAGTENEDIDPWVNDMLDVAINGEPGERYDISQVPSKIRTKVLGEFQRQYAILTQEAKNPGSSSGSSDKMTVVQNIKNRGTHLLDENNPIGKLADKVGGFFKGLFN